MFADREKQSKDDQTEDMRSRTSRHSESPADYEDLGEFTEEECFMMHECLYKFFDYDNISGLDKSNVYTMPDVSNQNATTQMLVQQIDAAVKFANNTSLIPNEVKVRTMLSPIFIILLAFFYLTPHFVNCAILGRNSKS